MTVLRGSRVFRRGDRLFDVVSYLCLYLDMQFTAFLAVRGDPIPGAPVKGHQASLLSAMFGVCVQYPVFFPFSASFNPALAAPFEIKIVDGAIPPDAEHHTSPEMGGASLMLWNMALVFFYDRQLGVIRSKLGGSRPLREAWPEIVRFAWALRNASAHNGHLKFDDDVRPVCWHHLKYTKADNGTKVIGDIMAPADVFIFLLEFSDELDRLGVPLP
jgi:hypothetical protein